MPADERVTVGLVRGLHGLRGAVRVEVLTDDPERFTVGSVLFVDGETRPLTVAWTGEAKPGLLVRFEGYSTRESAEPLRDRYLEVVADQPLPEGSWYWHQIRGVTVTTTTGLDLGKVIDVFRAGEGEVYVVQGGPLGELMVPAVRDVIVELDPRAGRLVVDPIALDLPDKPPRRRRRHEVTRRSRKAAWAARAAERRSAVKDTGEAPDASAPLVTAEAPDVPALPEPPELPEPPDPPEPSAAADPQATPAPGDEA